VILGANQHVAVGAEERRLELCFVFVWVYLIKQARLIAQPRPEDPRPAIAMQLQAEGVEQGDVAGDETSACPSTSVRTQGVPGSRRSLRVRAVSGSTGPRGHPRRTSCRTAVERRGECCCRRCNETKSSFPTEVEG
jgi:hypothetical protein